MSCCLIGSFDIATKFLYWDLGSLNLNCSPKKVKLFVYLRGLFESCQGWDITWHEAWWQYHFIFPNITPISKPYPIKRTSQSCYMKFCSYIRKSGVRYCDYRWLVREGDKEVTGYLKICWSLLRGNEENHAGLNRLQFPVPGRFVNRAIFLSNASNATEIC